MEMTLNKILEAVKNQEISAEDAAKQIDERYYQDIGIASIDTHREERVGFPEVIYCEGKTTDQVVAICQKMHESGENILGTRASKDMGEAVKAVIPQAHFDELARTIRVDNRPVAKCPSTIAIVCAGTSDLPVAREAAITADFFGNTVESFTDVGVAGIHRLFGSIDRIRAAKVVIVLAGMEGALASVVGGLVDKPVIAVPTSIGYGANFGGLSALLAMLNSCAIGVSVVNIDNGFGAACQASMINKL